MEARGDGGGTLRLAAGAGALVTDLSFSGAPSHLTEQSLSASASWALNPRWTLLGGAGALLGGGLGGASLSAGALAFAGASVRVLAPDGAVPLLAIAATLSALHAGLAAGSLTSLDGKLSVTAAWPIARRFAPHLTAAVFGGPVWAGGNTGSDRYHYEAIVGLAVVLPRGLDLFVEGSPVGAQTLSGGLGFTY